MNIAGILKSVGFGDIIEKGAKAIDDMVVTEKELKMEEMDLARAQIEVNKIEAAHSSRFVAGARPALLWICGAAFGYTFVLGPIIEQLFGQEMVRLDMGPLMTVLMGILGLGGLRTVEKLKGVARERIK